MRTAKFTVAITELFLILPAAVFLTALFVRNLQPLQLEPAHTAQQIVNWFAGRPRIGLWGLLIALPFTVLLSGGAVIIRRWTVDPALCQAAKLTFGILREHLSTVLVAAATLTAGGTLAIVALHVLAD